MAIVERKWILLEPTMTKSIHEKKLGMVEFQKFRKIIFKPLTASKLNLSSELNDDAQI